MNKVDAYIDGLSLPQQQIINALRHLCNNIEGIEERFSFGIPFYYYHGMFCSLSKKGAGVSISFCRGKDLVGTFPQLEQQGRTVIAWVVVNDLAQIQSFEIPQMINAAAIWNKEAKKQKIPLIKKKSRS